MGGRSRQKASRGKHRRKKPATKAGPASPYINAGLRSRTLGWYLNQNWRETGQAAVFALRRAPEGGLVLASFFVDTWCMGLKDAWGRLDLVPDERDDLRAELDEAMRQVAQCHEALSLLESGS
jgi:hypothetical protein